MCNDYLGNTQQRDQNILKRGTHFGCNNLYTNCRHIVDNCRQILYASVVYILQKILCTKGIHDFCVSNRLGISPFFFYQIIKKDLRWHPYKMIRRHNLKNGDYDRRFLSCQCFLHQSNNRRFLSNFVIGDECHVSILPVRFHVVMKFILDRPLVSI